jgi:hypothetical protein
MVAQNGEQPPEFVEELQDRRFAGVVNANKSSESFFNLKSEWPRVREAPVVLDRELDLHTDNLPDGQSPKVNDFVSVYMELCEPSTEVEGVLPAPELQDT